MRHVDHMQRNRFELKYVIDERLARAIRDFARPHLVRDPHARPEMSHRYPIYSLYLDSPGLATFNATQMGQRNRFKLRIRYYNDKPDSPVFYEIKRRVNDVILKERAAVKRSSVERLLTGRAPERSDLKHEDDPEAFAALTRFCQLQQIARASGRAIVTYTREAWNAPDNDDARMTFDRDVCGATYDGSPLTTTCRWAPVKVVGGGTVLELKFTGRFPNWMRDMVQTFHLRRVSMAKYVRCVETLGPRGPTVTPNMAAAASLEQAARLAALLDGIRSRALGATVRDPAARGPAAADAALPPVLPAGGAFAP